MTTPAIIRPSHRFILKSLEQKMFIRKRVFNPIAIIKTGIQNTFGIPKNLPPIAIESKDKAMNNMYLFFFVIIMRKLFNYSLYKIDFVKKYIGIIENPVAMTKEYILAIVCKRGIHLEFVAPID